MKYASSSPIEMVMDEIDRDECLRLLATQSIGRLAVPHHGAYPPHIVPVNYVLDGDSLVFRSDAGLKFKLSILAEHSVSFEVDSIDTAGRMAWSVVVQGRAEMQTEAEVEARDYESRVDAWAPGERPQWVRIIPYAITGRRLRPAPISPAATIDRC